MDSPATQMDSRFRDNLQPRFLNLASNPSRLKVVAQKTNLYGALADTRSISGDPIVPPVLIDSVNSVSRHAARLRLLASRLRHQPFPLAPIAWLRPGGLEQPVHD